MGKEGQNGDACTNGCVKSEARYTWEEVQKHNTQTDKWLVIDRKVYNITQWSRRHPGGVRVISHFAGEDASEAFLSFHPDLNFVRKFLKPLYVGELAENEPSQDREKNPQHIEDFLKLRKTAEEMNLFRSSWVFFGLCLAQNVVLEILAWASLYYLGTGWIPTLITILLLTISQAQAGWLQHDLGHLSVFKTSKWNHFVHKFIIGHLKGASANWWNHRHFQHHAKPNILSKDPDVNSVQLFVLGDTEPVEFGIKKIKFLPYNHQHQYFFLIGPPLLIPLYFTVQIMKTMISRKDWVDLSWSLSYYARYFITFVPFFGFFGSIALLNAVRFLESHWFVWVTQMNHIPMEIDHEKHRDWLACQLAATCNLEPSYFNDWFTGHLNFQIEHHLFPTMPRHNYYKISPLVRSLCKKHNLNYEEKTLYIAVRDVVGALKKSGKLWLDAYLHK